MWIADPQNRVGTVGSDGNTRCWERPLDVSLRSNLITGCCHEHSSRTNLSYTCASAVDNVVDEIRAGSLHAASEAFTFAVAGLGEQEHRAVPLAAFATCKKGTPVQMEERINEVVTAWTHHGDQVYDPMWAFASDGDNKRRIAFNSIFRAYRTLFVRLPELAPLKGFDECCSSGGIVATYDWRHLLKRLRNQIINPGARFVANVAVTGADLRGALRSSNVAGTATLFNPMDKQNVAAAQQLISALAACPPMQPSEKRQEPTCGAFSVLQAICRCFTVPLDTSLGLAEQLTTLSQLGHLFYCLYRVNASKFFSAELYHDLQSFIKSAFVLALRGKTWPGGLELCLGQVGSDALEEHFSLLRTLNHNSNFNTYELEINMSIVAQINGVFESNPGWRRGDARRDCSSSDRSRVRTVTGDINCSDVDVFRYWYDGRKQAAATLSAVLHSDTLAACWSDLDDPDTPTSLLCPMGAIVGVTEDFHDEEELLLSALLCDEG
eukprot:GHVU01067979.1.p1 GENE.GHVU01067979.1~~GHVU01067979.1.p1  ORF type:complete len:494 (+),score=66.56 GHVU01067979.1:1417-2898(+)